MLPNLLTEKSLTINEVHFFSHLPNVFLSLLNNVMLRCSANFWDTAKYKGDSSL
jgi:hypothetical protein